MTPEIQLKLLQDLRRYVPTAKKVSLRILSSTVFRQPGFMSCVLFRCAEDANSRGRTRLAQMYYLANLWLTGADVIPGCAIDGGLMIRHANGIVVGVGAVIGKNCTILQQVTIGAASASSVPGQRYPRLGDTVTLGAGSRIIGDVSVGEGAVVGANAVVIKDVAPNSTVVGVPARRV
jgi:serine O-acetyltransferase